jgi:hypothetical protein
LGGLFLEKPVIVTRGFLVSVSARSPTYEYEFDVTHMHWDEFREFLRELAEVIRERDEGYSEKKSRGRSLKVYYKRAKVLTPSGKATIRELKYLRLSSVPSRVLSILSSVKQDIYMNIIPTYCEKLPLIQAYESRHVVYFLPDYNLEPFVKSLKQLNTKIYEANKIMLEYTGSPYFERINSILREHGYPPIPEPEPIPPIEYDVIPLILDTEAVKQWIENRELMEEIEEKVREKQRQIIEKAISQFRESVSKMVEEIRKQQLTPEKAKEALESLRKISASVGIQATVAPILDSIEESIDNPQKINREIAKQLDKRLKTLLENL